MERDYDDLNRVRNAFFERVGLRRIPASTGIQGGVYPCDRGGSMDLYAFRTERPVEIDQMHASTLNEAWDYGSSFARGMRVTREDRTVLYEPGSIGPIATNSIIRPLPTRIWTRKPTDRSMRSWA